MRASYQSLYVQNRSERPRREFPMLGLLDRSSQLSVPVVTFSEGQQFR